MSGDFLEDAAMFRMLALAGELSDGEIDRRARAVEIRGDRVIVDASMFRSPSQAQTWPRIMWKADIRARLAGRPHARFDPLERHRRRAEAEEAERTRLYGPPVNLGVDRRGTPPTRAERHDPRWNIGPHWSGLPQRIVGIAGLPRPGKPQVVPRPLDYRGPREYWWPTDTEEGLRSRWMLLDKPVGWRMDPDRNCGQGCLGPGPLPENPHVGFWYDAVQNRLGEVYDPAEEGRLWLF
jgi:hypothetical protein